MKKITSFFHLQKNNRHKIKLAIIFMLTAVCGCALNEDVSDRPIDTKLSLCLRANGVDNTPLTSSPEHSSIKPCILQAIKTQAQSGESLPTTLMRMGFDCESNASPRCTLTSRQREYGEGLFTPDYSKYLETDSVVQAKVSGNRITSLNIKQQGIGADGKPFGPAQTNDSIPQLKP